MKDRDQRQLIIVRQGAAATIGQRIKAIFTRQGEESLTDRIDRISAALRAAFKVPRPGGDGETSRFWYPREVFDDYVISSEDETSKLFKIPYAIGLEDAITFGEPVEVEEEYVEVDGHNPSEWQLWLRQLANWLSLWGPLNLPFVDGERRGG